MHFPSFLKKSFNQATSKKKNHSSASSDRLPTAESKAPTEIIDLILEHSDPRTLASAMDVSQKWRDSAQDPSMMRKMAPQSNTVKSKSIGGALSPAVETDTRLLVQEIKTQARFASRIANKQLEGKKLRPTAPWKRLSGDSFFEPADANTVRVVGGEKFAICKGKQEFKIGNGKTRLTDLVFSYYTCELWDLSKKTPKVVQFKDPEEWLFYEPSSMRGIEDISVSPNGSTAVIKRAGRELEIWRFTGAKQPVFAGYVLAGSRTALKDIAFLPGDPYLLARDADAKSVSIFGKDTLHGGRQINEANTVLSPDNDISSLSDCISPDMQCFASGPKDGGITIHWIASQPGKRDLQLRLPSESRANILEVKSFTGEGRFFAGQSLSEGRLYLWNLEKEEPILCEMPGILVDAPGAARVSRFLPVLTSTNATASRAEFLADVENFEAQMGRDVQQPNGRLEIAFVDLQKTEAKAVIHHRITAEGLQAVLISPNNLLVATQHDNQPFKIMDLLHPERAAVSISETPMAKEQLSFSPGSQYTLHQYESEARQVVTTFSRPSEPARPLLTLNQSEVLAWTARDQFAAIANHVTHQVDVWSFEEAVPKQLYTLLNDRRPWKLAASEQSLAWTFFRENGETISFA